MLAWRTTKAPSSFHSVTSSHPMILPCLAYRVEFRMPRIVKSYPPLCSSEAPNVLWGILLDHAKERAEVAVTLKYQAAFGALLTQG